MNSTQLALGATLSTTLLWTAKAVAIGIAGGLDRSPLESPLFLLGLVCCLVAAASTGVALARPRTAGGRTLAATGGIVAATVVAVVASAVVAAVRPLSAGWAWEEVNLWAMALLLLTVNLALRTRRSRPEGRSIPARSALGA